MIVAGTVAQLYKKDGARLSDGWRTTGWLNSRRLK